MWHDGVLIPTSEGAGVTSPVSAPCLCDDSPSVQNLWASELWWEAQGFCPVPCGAGEGGAQRLVPGLWSRPAFKESHQAEGIAR